MRRLFLFAIALLAITVPFSFAGPSATTYYVSPSGSDSNPGTASAPWQTINKVNQTQLQPGDTVLFQGGQTFQNASLMPSTSGSSSAPITFGSYGTGSARFVGAANTNDVWIPSGGHDLVFDNLDFSGAFTTFGSSAGGPGTYDITIENSAFHDTPQAALNIANPQDHAWTVTNDTFTHTGESAIFIWGNNITISHSTFTDIGWNTSLTWARHGVYDKGPNNTIAYNDFSNIQYGQAISIRFHGARVYGNTIHDTPWAIAFFDYDTATGQQGTSYIYDNRAWNISGWAFYYSNQTDPQGNAPTVDFVVASNTFALSNASEAVNLSEVPPGAAVTLANNVFTGTYGSEYRGCATCSEYNNDWYGGTSNIPSGTGDLHVNPNLSAGPALALASGTVSPLTDAGTTNVPGLTYTAACDGAPLDYCGSRPDQGAVESASSSGSGNPVPQGGGGTTVTTTTTTTTTTTPTPPVTTTTVTTTPVTTTPVTTTPVTTTPVTTTPTTGTPPGTQPVGNPVAPTTSAPGTNTPSAPGSLHFAATRTGGVVSWSPATDSLPITGYRVLVNGNIVAVTTELSQTLSGLPCHTGFILGVAALNSAGHVSPTLKLPEETARCGTHHSGLARKGVRNKALWKLVRSERSATPTVTHARRDAPQIH